MLAILLFLGVFGREPYITVDLLEVNHNSQGWIQVIAWEWSNDYKRYYVMDWEMVKNHPRKIGPYWHVGRVRSLLLLETWSTEDPERLNLRIFPEKHRIKVLQ